MDITFITSQEEYVVKLVLLLYIIKMDNIVMIVVKMIPKSLDAWIYQLAREGEIARKMKMIITLTQRVTSYLLLENS